MILPRLKDANSESDVVTILHKELVRSFGVKLAGDREQPIYREIASEIWTAWLKFISPTV